MKVFMSWSGSRSQATASLLCDWIKCVLQASKPWISTRGIDRGALWFSEINNELKDTAVGIVCLTHENKDKPWILFEAGALAKGLNTSRVCTFLVDLEPKHLQDPLAQFNHTLPNREGLWSLVVTLNNALDIGALDERILLEVFNTYWPQFEEKFAAIIQRLPQNAVVKERAADSILEEILESTRATAHRVRELEKMVLPSRTTLSEQGQLPLRVTDAEALQLAIDIYSRGFSEKDARLHLIGKGLGKLSLKQVMEHVEQIHEENAPEK